MKLLRTNGFRLLPVCLALLCLPGCSQADRGSNEDQPSAVGDRGPGEQDPYTVIEGKLRLVHGPIVLKTGLAGLPKDYEAYQNAPVSITLTTDADAAYTLRFMPGYQYTDRTGKFPPWSTGLMKRVCCGEARYRCKGRPGSVPQRRRQRPESGEAADAGSEESFFEVHEIELLQTTLSPREPDP